MYCFHVNVNSLERDFGYVIYLHHHTVNVVKFFTVQVIIAKSRYSTYIPIIQS